MPKHPIYTAMLTDGARAAIGLPHPSGRAAMRMLEREGFRYANYVDIFDGGPTMTAMTDQVRSIRDAREQRVAAIDEDGGDEALVATGTMQGFRCTVGLVREAGDGMVLARDTARALRVAEDARVWHVGRW
jgi:arginine N-succinyltransferase